MISNSKLAVSLFWGRKGSGKSYINCLLFHELLKGYNRVEKKYPSLPVRKCYSNTPFSTAITDREKGRHLEYWTNPRQLYSVRNGDIIWDEVQKDLPTGSWQDTPRELKQVFSHLRKRGNRIYLNAQVYEDIDISVRRQVDYAWHTKKMFGSRDISVSLPHPKVIWGLIKLSSFDPLDLEVEKKNRKPNKIFPKVRWIRRKYVNAYDTTAELPPFMPDALEHFSFTCYECDKLHIEHKKAYTS